jgi:hypothetical protein
MEGSGSGLIEANVPVYAWGTEENHEKLQLG